MPRFTVFAALFLGVLLGAGAVWLVLEREAAVAVEKARAAARLHPPEPKAPPPGLGLESRERSEHGEPTRTASNARGSGSIAGQIRTRAGHPIADMELIAVAIPTRDDPSAPVMRTRSLADGGYRLSGLSNRRWSLRAFGAGHRMTSNWSDVRIARPGQQIDWIAEPVGEVPVRVVDAEGNSVPGATIRLLHGYSSALDEYHEVFSWSAADPILQLPAGSWQLAAAPEETEVDGWVSTPRPVEVRLGEHHPEIVLEARPALGIRVVTRLPPGATVWSYSAILRPLGNDEVPEPSRLLREGIEMDRVGLSDRYATTMLAPGRYQVGVRPDWRDGVLAAWTTVELRDRTVEVTLDATDLGDARLLTVLVESPTGEPIETIEDFPYALRDAAGEVLDQGSFDAVTRDGGRYGLPGVQQLFDSWREHLERPTATLSLEIRCQHPAHGIASGTVSSPEVGTIQLTWREDCRVELTFPGLERHPARRWLAVRLMRDGPHEMEREASLSACEGGVIRFAGLEPGSWTLSLGTNWGLDLEQWRDLRTIELGVGTTRETVALPEIGEIRLTSGASAPPPAHEIAVIDLEGYRAVEVHGTSQPEPGTTVIGPVQSGTYLLLAPAENERYRVQEVEVGRGTSSITWNPRQEPGWLVHVTPDSTAHEQGLRTGDRLISFGGLDPAEQGLRRASRDILQRGAPVAVVVERRGARLSFTLPVTRSMARLGIRRLVDVLF